MFYILQNAKISKPVTPHDAITTTSIQLTIHHYQKHNYLQLKFLYFSTNINATALAAALEKKKAHKNL